jgi:hypothetical protein
MALNGNLFVPLGGWGRNINHDPASVAYRAARRGAVTPKDVGHEIHIAPMDQGNLGSCVPHAGTAMLATDPFWDTLDADLKAQLQNPANAEGYAVQAYREVTALDPYPGQWEPDDTGSDGLSLWKLLRARGLVGGSEHVMSIDDAHVLIQKAPYPIGISWLSGMDTPGTDGVCKVTGRSRGGHEVLVYRYDLVRDLWWIRNSWSADWGLRGDFAIDTPGYLKLMSLQADGTGMTPTTAPTPQPVDPVPPVDTNPFPFVELDIWSHRALNKHGAPAYERIAAQAYEDWKAAEPQ